MHLAALVESENHVCTRYRLRAFQPALHAAGHSLTLHELPSGLGRLGIGNSLRDADVVVLQRKLLSNWELALLRRRVKKLWFDMDDAVWMRDSFAAKGHASTKRERRFAATMYAVDRTIAGNRFLADHARNAVVIPTCVDINRYPVADHAGPCDLVWVGSSSTLQGLRLHADSLEAVGRQVPGVRLKLVCDRFLTLKSMPVVEVPWTEAGETNDIASSGIGVSWIPDDAWSRGKCGLKVLQYMAAGLPVVANPVGVHPEMIEHGESGFLATTEAEWVEAVRTLAGDADLRRRLGARGRAIVQERYSVEAGARHWIAAIAHG